MTPTVSADVIERMARAHRDALIAPGAWDGMVAHSPSLAEAHRAAMTAALEAGGLIEALAPFAEFAPAVLANRPNLPDDGAVYHQLTSMGDGPRGRPTYATITAGDFRRAASLFTQGEQS